MARYVAAPRRPTAIQAGDDYWPETRETLDVIVTEQGSVDTGLVDEHGVTIWRTPARHKVGF